MNYYIDKIKNWNINDNYLNIKCDFKSDSDIDKGQIQIGITDKNDIVLNINPWGINNNNYKPIKYNLRDIEPNNVHNTSSGFKLLEDDIIVSISQDRLTIEKNSNSIELILDQTTDIKNNLYGSGTGYKTKKFENHPEIINKVMLNIRMENERIYGGGERFENMDLSGSTETTTVTQGAGTKNNNKYKAAPKFISSRGYGYIINTYSNIESDFGHTSNEIIQISCSESSSEFIFSLEKSPKEVLKSQYKYNTINKNPPMWTYGFWTSRNTYESWSEIIEIAEKYREENVPCDVIHIDPGWINDFNDYKFEWGSGFENPTKNINKLNSMNFKISLWIYPYIPINSTMYKDAEDSYIVKHTNGGDFVFKDNRGKLVAVDFTNPNAVEWWSKKLSKIISDGIDVIKADFGEYISEDTVFYNGKTGSEIGNKYPELYQKACESAFNKSDKKPILWSRSGWLSQNQSSIHWNGDAESDWNGLRSTIKSGLNASMSSYSYWGSDVGGYKNKPSDTLYGEWLKFSLFSPYVRAHGKSPREPWDFNKSYKDSKRVLSERYKIIPYIYSYGQIAQQQGIPIMRPMSLFDEDKYNTNYENTQYMLGDHVLVSPYINQERFKSTYLPDTSKWISYWNEKVYEGGQEIELSYDECIIPVFVRKGSAIPKMKNKEYYIEQEYDLKIDVYGKPEDENLITPYYNNKTLYDLIVKQDGSLSSNLDLEDIDVNRRLI